MLKDKRSVTIRFFMFLLITVSIFISMSAVFGKAIKVRYISENNINLRKKPSLKADVVKILKQGEKLHVESYKDGWVSVSLGNGIKGWVHEKFVTSQNPNPPSKVASRGDISTLKVRYICSEGVNLRQSPSLSSSIVSVMDRGEKIFVQTYKDSGWVGIFLEDGTKGWVHEKFISTSPNTQEQSKVRYVIGNQVNVRSSPSLNAKILATAKKGFKVIVESYNENGWVKVALSDGTKGWIHEKFVGTSPDQTPGLKLRYILGQNVNLRSGPSSNSSIVGSVSSGEKVSVSAYHEDGWAYIQLSSGTQAWIKSAFLTSSPVYPGMKVRYVCGNGVNVREEASLTSSVVTVSNAGDKAFVKTYNTSGWVYVVLEGERKGWINEKFLTDSLNQQNSITVSKIRYIQGNGVNLRKGPGLDNSVITTFKNGVKVDVESYDNKGWILVSADGYKGWVYKGYVGVDILPDEMVAMTSSKSYSDNYSSSSSNISYTTPKNTYSSASGNGLVDTAYSYMGVPYVWGGTTAYGFDCSGFAQRVYADNGISILRTADAQFTQGISLSREELQPGDLVFFTTYTWGASHVGIYIGNSEFIHASSGAGEVTINSLNDYYYNARFLGGRRI
ncbi:MAG: putative peptidoglycan endopeptidase LytE precursor [bacterium ADurb.Bin363]|nr:MAG: putative peptidoglycan endopeptidase LytE precursor [bacterium ADurb.Bin363]